MAAIRTHYLFSNLRHELLEAKSAPLRLDHITRVLLIYFAAAGAGAAISVLGASLYALEDATSVTAVSFFALGSILAGAGIYATYRTQSGDLSDERLFADQAPSVIISSKFSNSPHYLHSYEIGDIGTFRKKVENMLGHFSDIEDLEIKLERATRDAETKLKIAQTKLETFVRMDQALSPDQVGNLARTFHSHLSDLSRVRNSFEELDESLSLLKTAAHECHLILQAIDAIKQYERQKMTLPELY